MNPYHVLTEHVAKKHSIPPFSGCVVFVPLHSIHHHTFIDPSKSSVFRSFVHPV
ncbi:MAG: hypothetical protein LBS16_07765 [Prevotellaceae bacterium]|nr:hypothetical protein [Prevotellaceae bacterium]